MAALVAPGAPVSVLLDYGMSDTVAEKLLDAGVGTIERLGSMTPEELEHGYGWIYQRLFSHASIWRRRPEDWQAVPLYLAMSYLYKRSNRFWHMLIKHNLVHAVWSPLVEATRVRHVRFRRLLAENPALVASSGHVVSAGV
jgi:hypothetical protein